MRNDFKIALSAPAGELAQHVVQQFGEISFFSDGQWPEGSEIVVFDCSNHSEDGQPLEESWRMVLEKDKTLGLIGLQEADRALLLKIADRKIKPSINNLFIRKAAGEERFLFTILPDFEKATTPDAPQVAEFLSERVFSADCQCSGPPVEDTPPINNRIWPAGYDLNGSIIQMISNQNFDAQLPYNFQSGVTDQSANLSAEGYFFLANGIGQNPGDGRYHAIIISRINNVIPITAGFGGYTYGYGLSVWAQSGGQVIQPPNVHVNYTNPRQTNTPPVPNLNLGGFICTQFGYDIVYDLYMQTVPQQEGAQLIPDMLVTPSFQQYVNQISAPGVQNFGIRIGDTNNTSAIQFSTGGFWTSYPQYAETMIPTPGKPSDVDEFVIISYLDFAPQGKTSYEVEFVFQMDFFANWDTGGAYQQITSEGIGQISVTIDLVKATQFSGSSSPNE